LEGVTLALFDIDGTLLRGAGEGRGAMARTAGELFGCPDMFEHLSFAGAVDDQIVHRALEAAGLPPTPRRIGRLRARYVRRLTSGFRVARGSLLPGVENAVRSVSERAEVGIITGNWRSGAQVKLKAYGLDELFSDCVGAFGEDAFFRDDLLPVAVRRARRRLGRIDRVLVIGDTPADISCARAGSIAMGADGPEVIAVAVETGFSDPEELRAAGPDLQLVDLCTGLDALLGVL
jgi:phosphoglycolate phosphatase-like HAD superfamily hydrolase